MSESRYREHEERTSHVHKIRLKSDVIEETFSNMCLLELFSSRIEFPIKSQVRFLFLSLSSYFQISHIAYCTSCIVLANYWDFYIELSWERPPTTFYNSKFLASILFDALRYFENTPRQHAGAGNDLAANYPRTTNFTRDTWYSRKREFVRSTSVTYKCALNTTQAHGGL